jgi:hypothetical protein
LKAERVAWAEALESEPKERTRAVARSPVSFCSTDGSKVQEHVSSAMRHRKDDPDLATVREADVLAKLPEAERKEWQVFRADVDALLGVTRTNVARSPVVARARRGQDDPRLSVIAQTMPSSGSSRPGGTLSPGRAAAAR